MKNSRRKLTWEEFLNCRTTPVLVTIKTNARIFQDFHFGRWPYCVPIKQYQSPADKNLVNNSNLVFEAKWCPNGNQYWDCKRHGFGGKDAYGNGSIFVYGWDSVNFIEGSYDTLIEQLRSGEDEIQKVIPRIKTSKQCEEVPEEKTA